MEQIVDKFNILGEIESVKPLGNGLINSTYKVSTREESTPDYVLQCINHTVFPNVEMLMNNIIAVTAHIRRKLAGQKDIERRCLRFVPLKEDKDKYYFFDGSAYWRIMVFIPGTITREEVTAESSCAAGKAFGNFQAMLADIPEELGETIKDFHNFAKLLKRTKREGWTK